MGKRFVDISVAIKNDVRSDPPGYEPRVEYIDHKTFVKQFAQRYEGLEPSMLPNGEASAFERVSLLTHSGTHMDAPWHYGSVMEDGTRSATIDELPLEWFFGDGVKLDLRHIPDGTVATAADIQRELDRIEYTLKPGDIVLVNTVAGARYGESDFPDRGIGIGREATMFLTTRGVRVAGIDAWSWDLPRKYSVAQFARDRDVSKILEGHKAGTKIAFCHMEKLHNLEVLPGYGFQVACFPVKIHAASAGWTRAVAIFDDASPT